MIEDRMRPAAAMAVLVSCLATLSSVAVAGDATHEPYVVRGNNHIIIGVSLDEAAVRAALPAGIEPAEGITGGYNIYRSEGGYNKPAYTRAYVWVDVQGYDSADGTKGRWLLWGVTDPGLEGGRADGYDFEGGSAKLTKNGSSTIGVAQHDGIDIVKAEIAQGEDGCTAVAGTMNYPVTLPGTGKLAMHQYPYAADICASTPVTLDVMVGDDHPLAKFKPTAVLWAAEARNLSFAGTTIDLE